MSELSRLSNAARLKAEAHGRRSARAAFDRVVAHGYSAEEEAFREIGTSLLTKWAREEAMTAEVGEVWLKSALAKFDALVADLRRSSRAAAPTSGILARLRDTASGTIRKFGFTMAPANLSPRHWEQVLVAVEGRMRGVALPEDWRDKLAEQMGRTKLDAHDGSES